jgi:hypothetical protein
MKQGTLFVIGASSFKTDNPLILGYSLFFQLLLGRSYSINRIVKLNVFIGS